MAQPNLVNRGLKNIGQTARAVRTGEGEGRAARLGRAAKKGIKRAKAGMDGLASAMGYGGINVDAYEDDIDDQRRRKKVRMLLGDDPDHVFVERDGTDGRDLAATVAPEFRAQVSAGLVGANTMTAGSTLVDGGGGISAPEDDGW